LNPYRSPAAAVGDAGDETLTVKLFAVSRRIGRTRYIAYLLALCVVFGFAVPFVATLLGSGRTGTFLWLGAWAVLLVLAFLLTVQRCHDFDANGWLALCLLFPPVNLMLLVVPGTRTSNRYGPPPPRNSLLVVLTAWLALPALVLLAWFLYR
jgi:uncharacterized membrane protein YhaH (DUF805 family)